ncbi:MAG: 2Fe-2S iron-sulfur cluster-binding protein [Proteobacteria bacterium]|nr:2Fe-2S iron-sulfur cluster-binding protein [Pseudomonadota bacterium]
MEFEIRFLPSDRRVRVARGTTLLDAAQRAGLPVASACGADGVCGRCGLEILEGAASLSPASDWEERVKRDNRVAPALRLACRIPCTADLTVTAPYW